MHCNDAFPTKGDTMRFIVGLALIATLTACGTSQIVDQGNQKFQIKRYEPVSEAAGARNNLDWEATELCPAGYEKLRDHVDVIDGKKWFVWDIKCT
jgi:hypothetical protein